MRVDVSVSRREDRMSPTKNPSEFTVVELKEKLKTLGLSAAGSKNAFISRLMEADLEGGLLGAPRRHVPALAATKAFHAALPSAIRI